MSGPLIILTGLIYLYVGSELIYTGRTGLGWAYIGYALANVGLYFDATKVSH